MFNKSKFKKYIKSGIQNTLIMDKTQGWVADGYAAYSITGMTEQGILFENLGEKVTCYYFEGKSTGADIINFERMIGSDCNDAPEIIITPFMEDSGQYLNRVFTSKSGANIPCQQKYLDILGDFNNYRYTQYHSTSPIFVWDGKELVCFILPVVHDPDYKVIKHG